MQNPIYRLHLKKGEFALKTSEQQFLSLYNVYSTQNETQTQADIEKTYRAVMQRAEAAAPPPVRLPAPQRKRLTAKKRFAVVLAAACAFLLLAAGVIKVVDEFRGVLSEAGEGGAPVPISAMEEVVNKTGVLPDETTENSGIAITVKGIVGDDAGVKIMLDMRTKDETPLAIKQPDGTYSNGELRADIRLLDENGRMLGGNNTFKVIEGGNGESYASLLLEITGDSSRGLQGKNVTLSIKNLRQFAVQNGQQLKLEGGSVAQAIAPFLKEETKLERSGYTQEFKDSEIVYQYKLTNDTGLENPLANGLTLTNAAVQDGILYLRGSSADEAVLNEIMNSAVLLNADGDIAARLDSSGHSGQSWTAQFAGVETAESLEGLTWVYGFGEGLYPLADGEWNFDVTLDYENLTRAASLEKSITWNGHEIYAKAIEVSPYIVQFNFEASPEVKDAILGAANPQVVEYTEAGELQSGSYTVTIKMKDGTEIIAASSAARASASAPFEKYFAALTYNLDVVINPADVESITLGDMVISGEELKGK